MHGTDKTGCDQPETAQASLDLDALAVSDRFMVTELLGFRPTRHTPLGTDATLYVPALDPDPSNPDDDED